ncbi:RluA family pseudouridine synthase [Kiritimatiellota bacterium B12222]|nr:RluA family pseudouridine synthase [Kiritimatiellota bacterium B12222]
MSKNSKNKLISPKDQGKTLLLYLREELQISNRQAKDLLDRRSVFVNGKRVWIAKHKLKIGDLVEYPPVQEKRERSPKIEIVYKDPFLLAVNKAPGLISDREKNSVEDLLRKQEGNPSIRALHRLDKETSGLLMFLYNSQHREAYLDLFRRQEIAKVYQCLLAGQPQEYQITVRKVLDSKTAETNFRFLKRQGEFCKAECKISTGRLHQIRRHALEINCRVAGDRKYAQNMPISTLEKSLPRQMLHAYGVEFICPKSKKKIQIHAPLAPDFQKAVKQMGLS